MKQEFYVTYQRKSGIYCSCIYLAENKDAIELYLWAKRRRAIDIHLAMPSELLEGKRKHMPFVEV